MPAPTFDSRSGLRALRGLRAALLPPTLLLSISAMPAHGARSAPTGTVVPGVRATLAGSAVVNFADLARQQALGLAPLPPVRPLLFPEFDDEGGEPGAIPGEPIAPGPPPVSPFAPQAPLLASPSPTFSFKGLDDIPMVDSSYIVIPPDVEGSVGRTRILEGLNNNYRVLDKATGATISTVGTATFWAPTGASLNSLTDPRTFYDPYNDRWIAVMQTFASSADILVGVSQTDDPGGAWNLYRFNTGVSIDFPVVGFDKNWIVVAINRYSAGGTFQRGITLVVNYPQARAGTGSGIIFTQASGTHFCSAPCVTYSTTADTEYVVTHLSSAGATYTLDAITGTPAAPVYTAGGSQTRTGGGWAQASGNSLPQSAPNSGASACGATPCLIEAQDSQIRSAPVFRGGSIWYTQSVGLPATGLTHTGVQWTRLTTPSGAFVEGGRLEDATATATNGGKWYAYPHIGVNAGGDYMVGFSQFSSAQHPSAGYAMHLAGDAAGTLRDPLIYHAGEDYYHKTFTTTTGRNRWGDFSTAQVDPDDATLWTVQEYGRARTATDDGNTGSNSSKWSTWWAAVGPPPPPTASLGPGPSQSEGNSGTTPFHFPVNLSAASTQPVTVNYQTSDGTATAADNDYTPASSSIVIPPGLTSDTIVVNVTGDTKNEADETFYVVLTGATNAVVGTPSVATGTILNDDPLPALAIDDVSLPEGNSGTTAFNFTASLSAVSGQNVQVSYQTADGSATVADTDYVAASGTATIAAGSLSTPITVLVNGDTRQEPDENFFVNLSSPVNATIADDQGVGTILNDDQVTAVAVAAITQFSLSPVAPNPSAGAAVRLRWAIPREARVRVTVLDVRGREVAVLAVGVEGVGWHSAAWNAAASGLYFLRMQAPGKDLVQRFAIIR